MSVEAFEAFKAELTSLRDILSGYAKRTVRDEELLDRFRMLCRTWTSIVGPGVEPLLHKKRDLLKLSGEIETLAQLTSKYKRVGEYRRHLSRALLLANTLVLHLPPQQPALPGHRREVGEDLFVSGVPDLPLKLVPNSLVGWRSRMQAFVNEYPFDRSVFIMIRYRRRNESLIRAVKEALSDIGLSGILASEHRLTDDLYNPVACLLCCARGLAVFDEAETGQVFNPNVAYELGMLHILGRDCRILKHDSLHVLHTDILMKLYLSYADIREATTHITDWLGSQT